MNQIRTRQWYVAAYRAFELQIRQQAKVTDKDLRAGLKALYGAQVPCAPKGAQI